jgi:hypothetical protein
MASLKQYFTQKRARVEEEVVAAASSESEDRVEKRLKQFQILSTRSGKRENKFADAVVVVLDLAEATDDVQAIS